MDEELEQAKRGAEYWKAMYQLEMKRKRIAVLSSTMDKLLNECEELQAVLAQLAKEGRSHEYDSE